MEYRRLGRTDVQVSAICLGTMTWGRQNTEVEGHAQMDYALERGVNFWDTAEMYAIPPTAESYGSTEKIIGTWFALRGGREKVVLASKAIGMAPGGFAWIREGKARLDRNNLVRAVEDSLTRLKTDYIDLYQFHWPDRTTARFGARGWKVGDDTDATPIDGEQQQLLSLLAEVAGRSSASDEVLRISESLRGLQTPLRRDLMAASADVLLATRQDPDESTRALGAWKREQDAVNDRRYGSHLYSESAESALTVPVVSPRYAEQPPTPQGFEVMQACFDAALARIPQLIAIGEDVGRLGGVNLGWAHLQQKYGAQRITDTGIREATIIGQAIGMALRGLRPIAEIQYLDYLLYALQIISDDLATLRWRTHGGQKAPVIISTRGHRLEGIWHSGSPMAGIVNLMRGLYVCVPRDAVQAAGFYNTMLRSDDAALIVEVLNGYRKRLPMPENIGDFTIPLGVPDIIRKGSDVTVVTYGACCDIAMEAASALERVGIDVEIVDVRTLLPFDTGASIRESIRETSRVLFLDEDCPGGITAYMMQEVLERQGAFDLLDSAPRTLSARPHRPAYGSDGDYFSKPNREQIIEAVYRMMSESDPRRFPPLA
jgi:pyruvate/2-oxoglutarate/acetoin dehydrogenase E1 component